MASNEDANVQGRDVRSVARAEHTKDVQWDLTDFVGKFHLNRMDVSNPIPGTATRVEQDRSAFMEKRASSLQSALEKIEARRRLRVKGRKRKAAITARVEVQATVGYRIDAVQCMYQRAAGEAKKQLSAPKYAPDAEFYTFFGYVETNNVYQVRSRLRTHSGSEPSAHRLVTTADENHGNTPLHRAISLGLVEMSSVLLEAGADIDAINTMGDAPIHCCWRFWKNDMGKYDLWRKKAYLRVTKQMQEDFARMERDVHTTVLLLRLLTKSGADVDAQRMNGEVAMHTAARRGPFSAIWILLLSQANHNIMDRRHETPEGAAVRAGNEGATVLLANWPLAKLKYKHSEYVQEWMNFLCDPNANLATDLTAKEVLGHVRMEQHEESTAVRARGGHLLVDEIITGPVLSAEQRANAKILGFSASDSVSMVTHVENSMSNTKSSNNSHCYSIDENSQSVGGNKGEDRREGSEGGKEVDKPPTKTKSKLGKEIDVFLAQARDETIGVVGHGMPGESTAYSRLVAKERLEARRSRWPGPRDNGKDLLVGGAGSGSSLDPFGRPMTTSQRRRIAALEIAEDGGIESPLIRAAVSSVLLITRSRAAKKETIPHPFYGRKLLTQRLLNQREREAKIKPTATIGMSKDLDIDTAGKKKRALYLNEIRTAFNDHEILPGPQNPSGQVDERGRLHALHPVMQWRKLHERPFSELQGSRKHNENVYDSTLENYCPTAWNAIGAHEPLLPTTGKTLQLEQTRQQKVGEWRNAPVNGAIHVWATVETS